MQRLCMLNPVIVRKTRREESRQKHDGIKMEKSCPRTAKCTMAINCIPSWIRRMILFDALKPPRQMFMTVRWICQKKGEVVYRDRGYQGAKCKGYSATMKRGARGHPIGIRDKLRNMRISRKRSKGERPYAVIKNIFHAGLVKVTTLQRVRVKNMLAAFCYNIYQVKTIQNRV